MATRHESFSSPFNKSNEKPRKKAAFLGGRFFRKINRKINKIFSVRQYVRGQKDRKC